MNYWRHKNHLAAVGCMISVRAEQGTIIMRDYFAIDQDVYTFKFPDLIPGAYYTDGWFKGSVEFEIFSNEDLKFTYPAISIFYASPNGVSSVHMAARVFHSIEDMDKLNMEDVMESGFDLLSEADITPYIAFTNGQRSVPNAKARLEIFNHSGESTSIEINFGDLKPYQTVFIFPENELHIGDFLQKKPGFCKVSYDRFGIFPRLLCGSIRRDFTHLTITHSYYDVSNRNEYFDQPVPNNIRPPFRAIPLMFSEDIELDLHFYPIYSPSELHLKARIYDEAGNLAGEINDIDTITSPSNKMVCINVQSILNQAEIPIDRSSLLSIEGIPHSSKIPTRINFGVNYHMPQRMGTNINISMHQNAEFFPDKRSYHWLPVFIREDLDNHILVTALSNNLHDTFEAHIEINIYSEQGLLATRTVILNNQSTKHIKVEQILKDISHTTPENNIVWFTLKSESPHITVYYLNRSRLGHIGGDHSF